MKGKKDLTAEKESSVEGNLFAAENPPLEIIEASKQYPENDYKALFGPRPGFAPLATVIDFTKDNSDQNTSGAGYQELLAGGTLIFTNPWDSFELLISAGTNYLDSLVTEALSSEKMDVRTGFAVEVLSGYTDTSLFTYDIKTI